MYADHFSLANIPFGVATSVDFPVPTIATRLHDNVIFIPPLIEAQLLQNVPTGVLNTLQHPPLNAFASLGRAHHRTVRQALQKLLGNQSHSSLPADAVAPIDSVTLYLPVRVSEFTDFSCSKHHNLNAGEAILGVRRLPPSFSHFPIGYGGRGSSIVVSGTSIKRPSGHYRDADKVVHGPSQALDYELEIACVVGKPLDHGNSVQAKDAGEHIFGVVILNDWSARDIQSFEMMPLGPMKSKNFGTTISPWIVTLDALEPFRTAIPNRDVPVAPHLDAPETSFNIQLQAKIIPQNSTASTDKAQTLCTSHFGDLYWSFAHLLAHLTAGGSGLRTGDILATGTVSGATKESQGCLLEATKGGKEAFEVVLQDGTKAERKYLEDGDSVLLTGQTVNKDGSLAGVGFGACVGTIVANGHS